MINKGNTEDILKEYGLKNDQLFALKKILYLIKKIYIKQVKKLSNIITLPNEINPDRMIVNILKTYPLNDLGNLREKSE